MLRPLPPERWDYQAAAHLLNRAGFGGTPAQVKQLLALGMDKAVASLVDYDLLPDTATNPEWAKPDPERATRLMAFRQATPEQRQEMQRTERRKQAEHLLELRHWWLQRMATSPRPLEEKLTLFWHGHFATSFQKVRDAFLMWQQNDTFRRHGSGNWLKLLTAVAKDPAMLIWLDQAQSRREHPNENFAREVMELFALGEGHYTEMDVTEAARALTGWSLDRVRLEFANRPGMHDYGPKTVLGKTGRLTGAEVLEQVVAQPQAARFITAKLWTFFVAEHPPAALVDALSAELRRGGNNFKPLLRTIFRSEEFYADEVVRHQIKSPVQWLVTGVRMLETELPPPAVASNALRLLGQDLFAPPNVKGWDGGLSWITTNNLLNRYNLAGYLVFGENPIAMRPERMRLRAARGVANNPRIDPAKLFTAEERRDKKEFMGALEQRLFHSPLREKHEKTLREYLDSRGELDDGDILHATRLLMATPEFQLC